MHIDSLHLINFRNFASLKLAFDPKLTVIIGPNGSGKSNILEALGLLATIRSNRSQTDLDLVKFGKSEAKIESRVKVESGESKELIINFQVIDERNVKKSFFVDGIRKRYVDLGEHFSMVVFEPLDLDLVSGPPSLRRHHLDSLLVSCDRAYFRAIGAYNKVVVRRNKVLQRIFEGKAKAGELDFWDERLLEHGMVVSTKREEFFEFIRSHLDQGATFSSNKGDLEGGGIGSFSWQLKQSLLSEEKLLRNRERDIAARMTLSGPHRDDFIFLQDDKNLEFFGSRGGQRMAVLALKMAELGFVAAARGSRPVLALDDIFSELDWEHREAVMSVVRYQQSIITAAEADSVPKKILRAAKVVELKSPIE